MPIHILGVHCTILVQNVFGQGVLFLPETRGSSAMRMMDGYPSLFHSLQQKVLCECPRRFKLHTIHFMYKKLHICDFSHLSKQLCKENKDQGLLPGMAILLNHSIILSTCQFCLHLICLLVLVHQPA